MECAGNGRSQVRPRSYSMPWGYEAVGTYQWTGTPLAPLIARATADAAEQGITGKAVTPFLLARLLELSGGATLDANVALVRNNARLGAAIARELIA